ncbi:MAG: PAS domain-containing protein [Gemmatimonadetes bacterium]|nr:PAS domain-containing protein [Gemmatimonadota bacterium]
MRPETSQRYEFNRSRLLRWVYVGRMTLAVGIFVGMMVAWFSAPPEATRIATLMFLATLAVTLASVWHTELRARIPGRNFMYAQVVLDALLVTAVIHITSGGGDVVFAPLYILVITEGALLLPLPGGVLIGALSSVLYFADLAYRAETLDLLDTVGLQIGLFAVVALITGWLGDRVQRTWLALGEVQSELVRLRLDTGDILANISTGVLTVVDGGRLGYLNRAGERFLDLSLEQWRGAPILDVVEEVAPGLAKALRRSIDGLCPVTRQTTAVKRPAGDLVLGISTTLLESREGEGPSVTAIFQDITDLERIQALNRRNERLEAVAELSASLAHEIKNPLASIRSAVEQLDSPKLPVEDRSTLQRLVLSESDRLSRLLNEFLDFSVMRLSAKARVDFTGVVTHAIALVKQHPDCHTGIRFGEAGLEGRLILPGDADLLHRLVFNLILNAVQFSGADGAVQISLENRADENPLPGSTVSQPVYFSVQDSGPGIPPEDVGRIFAPFFTTRKGGSGLGLAVVHRAVEAHGGAVYAEEVAGGGTRFVVLLPGTDVAAETEQKAAV